MRPSGASAMASLDSATDFASAIVSTWIGGT
jgi:hypothetical protein